VPSIIPDRVAHVIHQNLPKRIREAVKATADAERSFYLCRTPLTAKAREYAISDIAAANKLLAAYNPGLIVTAGGAR
jgi:hypothetical protein